MSDIEVWRQHPEFCFIEASTFGRIRTLDRKVPQGSSKRFVKGQILKKYDNGSGYLMVQFSMNGKNIHKLVHRLVAETFISNPNNWAEVNHRNNDPTNNNVDNLEWCTHEYNIEYREKYGVSANEYISKKPVFAVSLKTLEVFKFKSRREAGRVIGVDHGNIYNVLKGRYSQTGGYWFTNVDDNAVESVRAKFGDSVARKIEELMTDKKL